MIFCQSLQISRQILLLNCQIIKKMQHQISFHGKHTIGVIQLCATINKESNLAKTFQLVKQVKAQGGKIAFIPEASDYIGAIGAKAIELAENIDGPTFAAYKALAKEENIWLSLGGFHVLEHPGDTRVSNSHIIISSEGKICGKYDKLHLFDLQLTASDKDDDPRNKVNCMESRSVIPGDKVGKPVPSPIGNIGLSICYDLRFPELSLALRRAGAQILTYPSAFTVPTGKAHWKSLLRARAIENQCYVIAAAQVGKHSETRHSYGHSMVVDPWGKVLCEMKEDNEGVIMAEIDLDELEKLRKDFPVLQHHRLDIFPDLNQPLNPITGLDISSSAPTLQFGEHLIPAACVFYRTSLIFSFVNRSPLVPGHVLVCPLRHVVLIKDLTTQEITELYRATQIISQRLEEYYETSASTISIQNGVDAGQKVSHVHVHVLPRKPNDFEQNDDIYSALEKETCRVICSLEEMTEKAALFRKLFEKS